MTMKRIRLRERLIALDAAQSARHKDADGYLHVDTSNLTCDQVAGYYGYEIPAEGLDPHKIYYAWRPAEELQKALTTFNGVPLLLEHKFDGAENPQKDLRVGAVGTDAKFAAPFVTNSLTVWDAEAIQAIEDGSLRDLSCGYWYTPDFTAGKTPDGLDYDFVMRDIKCNHVALVSVGRATDCFVADSMPDMEENPMAENEKACDTAEEAIRAAIEKAGLVLDPEQVDALVKALAEANAAVAPKAEDDEAEEKLAADEEEKPAADEEAPAAEEAKDEEPAEEKAADEEAEKAEDEGEEEPAEEKKPAGAVDADEIIRVATEKATQRVAAMFQAAEEVKSVVGAVQPMAFDSAPAIYEHALAKLGVDDVKGEAAASTFRAIMKQRKTVIGAQDAKPESDLISKRLNDFLE